MWKASKRTLPLPSVGKKDATKLHLALPLQGSPPLQYFVQALPPGGVGSNNYKAGWVLGLGWNWKHSTKS